MENTENNQSIPIQNFERDEHGLVKGLEYKYTSDGRIDWYAMLKSEHLYVMKNKEEAVEKQYGKPVSQLDLTKVDKKYICILLTGLRYLSLLRGYEAVSPKIDNVFYDTRYEAVASCTVTCKIEWIGNFETGMKSVSYGGTAGATLSNTDPFVKKYIETIAENRAFCRAVRGFLNISVVSKDEIGPDGNLMMVVTQESSGTEKAPSNNAVSMLQKRLDDEKWSFDVFKRAIIKNHKDKFKNSTVDPEKWESIKDIPPRDIFLILGVILPPT